MDIMVGLAAAGQALDAAKKLKDIAQHFDEATFKIEIANLMLALADTKAALAEAKQSIIDRDAEIAQLSRNYVGKMPVIRHRGYSFGIDPTMPPRNL